MLSHDASQTADIINGLFRDVLRLVRRMADGNGEFDERT